MPPHFRQPKRRGEWAELKFLLRATEEHLVVSKPYGDSARFDFIVGDRPPLYRVQVKSTSIRGKRCYLARMTHCYPPRRYRSSDFDFLAVYVIPCRAWYIVPMGALGAKQRNLSLYPHVKNSTGHLERFREAWHLLKQAAPASYNAERGEVWVQQMHRSEVRRKRIS